MGSVEVIKLRQEQAFQQAESDMPEMRYASVAVSELVESLSRHCEEISAHNHSPVILFGETRGTCFLRGLNFTYMAIHWHGRQSNNLAGSNLRVAIYEGPPSLHGNMIIKRGKCMRVSTFAFGLLSQNRCGFFEGKEPYDAPQLAEKLIKWYLDEGSRALQRRMR